MYQIYHAWIHLLNHSPSSPPPLIPGVVSTGIIFCIYLHVYTFHCTIFIFLPPFPNTSPLPLVPALPPVLDLFCPPVLWFCRRKKKTRESEKHDTLAWDKGSYTVIFPVCMHYNPTWLISSHFLHSTLVHFLWLFQSV
jgi:hypothetical protein